MEFVVNEAVCRNLSDDMKNNIVQIAQIASNLEGMDGTLRAALGEDYDKIANSINIIKSEIEEAANHYAVIHVRMTTYIQKVGQVKAVLGDG